MPTFRDDIDTLVTAVRQAFPMRRINALSDVAALVAELEGYQQEFTRLLGRAQDLIGQTMTMEPPVEPGHGRWSDGLVTSARVTKEMKLELTVQME